MPRLTPATFQGDTRRRVPKVSKNKRVPLWTVEPDGQLFTGVIRVPVRLCNAELHTNARHEFENLLRANLSRWVEWRRLRGWVLNERPRVAGPYDPPEGDRTGRYQEHAEKKIGRNGDAVAVKDFDYPEEIKWYIAEARFKREEPVYVRLEDMITLRHMALQYQIDPDRDPPTQNQLPEAKDEIVVEGGLDPMQVAEERRKALGLKREDYLMGRVQDPL